MAKHLVQQGHDVVWWNSTVNHQRKEQRANCTTVMDTPEGYKLALLYGRLYARNISIGRILSQIENARAFAALAPQMPKPDVILCGYPPIELAEAAVRFAKSIHVPIAIDFRDMWPDVIAEYLPRALRYAAFPMLMWWTRSLRYTVRNATSIVGVTDGFVDWALKCGARQRGPLDKAFHLAIDSNSPTAQEIAHAERFWDDRGVVPTDKMKICCFAGTLSRRLDIRTLVSGALQISDSRKARSKLVICGKGDQESELRELARNQPHIVFGGWRNAAELFVLMRRCSFGTLPYFSTVDFVQHYPNKVGEYLGAGLPIMTGLTGQVRQLLTERGLGFFYEEGNPQSAAECLEQAFSDERSFVDTREAAYRTYQEFFDPKEIYPAFCRHLEDLASSSNTLTQ